MIRTRALLHGSYVGQKENDFNPRLSDSKTATLLEDKDGVLRSYFLISMKAASYMVHITYR